MTQKKKKKLKTKYLPHLRSKYYEIIFIKSCSSRAFTYSITLAFRSKHYKTTLVHPYSMAFAEPGRGI
jgi:hypothetical protein